MKVLVTGCAGLIGSHLVDFLLDKNYHVCGIDNLSYGSLNNLDRALKNKNFTFLNVDVKNICFELSNYNFDLIFHLATLKKPFGNIIRSSLVLDENYNMIREVIKYSLNKNSFLIFTSTSDVYGNSKTFTESEKITIGPPTNERYSYAMSKLIGEQFLFNEVKQSQLKASVIRIFGCASERSSPNWNGGHVPLFAKQALLNEDIVIHGDGLQTRSISSAKDIAMGISSMSENLDQVNNQIINLGTNEQTTVLEIAKYIIEKTNSSSKIIHIPKKEVFSDYDEIKIRFANIDKATKILNFKISLGTFQVVDDIIENFKNPSSKYYVTND